MSSSFCADAVGNINFYELGFIIVAAIDLMCLFMCCAMYLRATRHTRSLEKRLAAAHVGFSNPATPTMKSIPVTRMGPPLPPRVRVESNFTPPVGAASRNPSPLLTSSIDSTLPQHFFSVACPGFDEDFLLRLRSSSRLDRLLETLPPRPGCDSILTWNGTVLDTKRTGGDMGMPTGINDVIQLQLKYVAAAPAASTRSPSVAVLTETSLPASTAAPIPWCEQDESCQDVNNPQHYRRYRHHCRIENCTDVRSAEHAAFFEHRTTTSGPALSSTVGSPPRGLPVCPENGYCRDVNEEWHQAQCLHTCALFPCPALQDAEHTSRFMHNVEHTLPAPPLCPTVIRGGVCTVVNDAAHSATYRHICNAMPCRVSGNAAHLRLCLHE